MGCPLCDQRKAKRACPALNRRICAFCCGTKRLTEIRCPSDCPYLATAREHPPAVLTRQHERDIALLLQFVRDFNERQSRLFMMIVTFLIRYEAPELQPLVDEDVAETAAAVAATFETASRGVIYEHRPASLPAQRLAAQLKPLLLEAGTHGGTAFERDAAVVLRRLEEAVRDVRSRDHEDRRALLDVLSRTFQNSSRAEPSAAPPPNAPRLIVP